ncbi:hypothetical protein ZIOFF_042669 [Zingiber officinale]|uniref:Neprosin PEP catalytic domain-containing protein n=1 Tax=Zingiber officinale TaxID=94328 RepID=A0A8J5FV70_ZINOF|nr:hypothetical protein ZIOFF_042669 [Zingiber officinale]
MLCTPIRLDSVVRPSRLHAYSVHMLLVNVLTCNINVAILIARASGLDRSTWNILAVRAIHPNCPNWVSNARAGATQGRSWKKEEKPSIKTIQLKPSFLPNGLKLAKPKPATFYGFNDTCPSGTILIERSQKSDYFRSHPVDDVADLGHHTDGYEKTGCVNLRCPGFVKTTSDPIGPGSIIQKFSVYKGEEVSFSLEIFKDPSTSNWWFLLQGGAIGYYPKELLPKMDIGVDRIQMGGHVYSPTSEASPPMGSGHPYTEGRKKAAYFTQVQFIDRKYHLDVTDGYIFAYGGAGGFINGLFPGNRLDSVVVFAAGARIWLLRVAPSSSAHFAPRLGIFPMTTSSTASALILAIILLLVAPLSPGNCASTGEGNTLFFSFGGSGKSRSFATEFALYGDAEMNSSEVRVMRAANESSGLMIYWKPVIFFGTKPGFSSSFSFSVSPGNGGGLAFFLSPISVPLEPTNGDWSRLSTSVVAVKFVTAASLVEVDVGGELLTKSSNLSDDGLLLILSRGEKLHSWIDYDGESKRIEVRLCQDKDPKEAAPSISHSIDLSYMLWREASWVGLSSWSGNSSHGSSIYSWNFTEKSKLCTCTIPVETRTLEELEELLEFSSQNRTSLTRIMLDNMVVPLPNGDVDVSMLKDAVQLVNGRFETEFTNLKYSRVEIDEVRFEWTECMLDYI